MSGSGNASKRCRRTTRPRAAAGGALLCAVAAAFDPEAVAAAASDWWRTEHGAVRLIAGAVGEDAEVAAGLHFRMKPGWKIYWRSPGDAGFPPRPDWTGSRNLAEARLAWPLPERFSVLGLETLGYAGEVVLPVALSPIEAGRPIGLRARVSYLTCADICVPYEARLSLDIPAGGGTGTRERGLIAAFGKRVPATGEGGPLRIATAAAVEVPSARAIEIRLRADAALAAPDVYVEGAEDWSFAAPVVRIDADGRGAVVRIAARTAAEPPASLVGRTLRLTVRDGGRAVEREVVLGTARTAPQASAATDARSLAFVLLLAVAGGLILNFMPCVLPVLSLKLLSVLGHGGSGAREVRKGFLASSAGILASFLLLATGVAALRLAGGAVGWGIQFQQPLFLVFMAAVAALFAANLFGLFEIRLPGRLVDAAAAGGGGSTGLGGHFATGAFATLLATPCSAPFVGTAVGVALSRGTGEIYAVFAALGTGLALPYLAVAAFPRLVTVLPRPGPWMATLRRLLGVALVATAVWLLSVLAAQTGVWRAVAVGAALAVLAVGTGDAAVRRLRRVGAGFGLSAAAAAAALALTLWPSGAGPGGLRDGAWRVFDRARIAEEVADGRLVFVDVTAEWCLTCQVNKALVLDKAPVRRRLEGRGVVAMRADWTRPDPAISGYLASFGRYGIPFNAVYGPAVPDGAPLPEILTRSVVEAALRRATGHDRR